MLNTNLEQSHLQGDLLENEPLVGCNTWKVGGPARYLYHPHDVDDLTNFIKQVPGELPILFLGLGSNVLIRDSGFSGIVVITQGRLKTLQQLDDVTIYAQAGVSCAKVARYAARLGLEGAEFLAGVPGTIGGALAMNAGCHGHETWEFVKSVETIDRQGHQKIKSKQDFEISYRRVKGVADEWFLSGTFQFRQGQKETALANIRLLLDRRAATQPTGDATCGSVFKNPPGDYAARLIESLGLKGFAIGGAHVSTKHANFIVNAGQATAQDIENLIKYIMTQVEKNYAIQLSPEVHIIGECA